MSTALDGPWGAPPGRTIMETFEEMLERRPDIAERLQTANDWFDVVKAVVPHLGDDDA